MRTLLEVLNLSADYLKNKGIENSRRQAEELLCDFLKLDRLKLYLNFEQPLEPIEIDRFRDRLAKRGRGEPIAYIHGSIEFYNCTFFVTPDVLIPRQETELLVDKVVKFLDKIDHKGKELWDICCGSGCIGIALKKRFPDLTVTLSDLSPRAIEIARKNAEYNQVDVTIVEGDLFTPFKGKEVDYLISNPPYIAEEEYKGLDIEVKQEPRCALISGPTGLEFYEKFAQELPLFLKSRGFAWFEIGYRQGKKIKELFTGPPWKYCEVENDGAGHSRFFFLEKE
jgi:release factor glutamine methyltransferase